MKCIAYNSVYLEILVNNKRPLHLYKKRKLSLHPQKPTFLKPFVVVHVKVKSWPTNLAQIVYHKIDFKRTYVRTYRQTCSHNNLFKTATCLKWAILSPPKQIPIQWFLYKTATCLTRPATTIFCLPNGKKPV